MPFGSARDDLEPLGLPKDVGLASIDEDPTAGGIRSSKGSSSEQPEEATKSLSGLGSYCCWACKRPIPYTASTFGYVRRRTALLRDFSAPGRHIPGAACTAGCSAINPPTPYSMPPMA